MTWFRRKQDVQPVAEEAWRGFQLDPLSPEPVVESPPIPQGVTIQDDGNIQINISSVEEAKAAIKQLKLKKKEYALWKKGVQNEINQLNAARKVRLANRMPIPRGGGNVGRMVRMGAQLDRAAERRQHAAAIEPFDAQKAAIDTAALNVDRAVAFLEQYIAEQQAAT